MQSSQFRPCVNVCPELTPATFNQELPWLSMAPKKRTSTGAVKSAFVAIKNVKDGQTVSIKGKVLSKSAVVSFGCKLCLFVFLVGLLPEASIAPRNFPCLLGSPL